MRQTLAMIPYDLCYLLEEGAAFLNDGHQVYVHITI